MLPLELADVLPFAPEATPPSQYQLEEAFERISGLLSAAQVVIVPDAESGKNAARAVCALAFSFAAASRVGELRSGTGWASGPSKKIELGVIKLERTTPGQTEIMQGLLNAAASFQRRAWTYLYRAGVPRTLTPGASR